MRQSVKQFAAVGIALFVLSLVLTYQCFYEKKKCPVCIIETGESSENQKLPVLISDSSEKQKPLVYMRDSSVKQKPPVYIPLGSKTLKPPGVAPAADEFERIWNYVYSKQYHCTESEYLGGLPPFGDGAYDLCIEKQFWPKRRDPSYNCLVYSFGVDIDLTFDEKMAKLGCEVHSFDPSINLKEGFLPKSGVHFHKVGISDEDNDSGYNGWKMRTLKTIIKELGHTNRYLDYLKVDTDKADFSGFEDVVMEQVLNTGLYKCIRQYSMEIHMLNPFISEKNLQRCRLLHNQMVRLNGKGWRLYNTTDNVRGSQAKKPAYNQRDTRKLMIEGKELIKPMLWESSFVNFDVESVCNM